MTEEVPFAERIRARYPEGLTGIFAVGGTRTAYVLENNRPNQDPGKIAQFSSYGEALLGRYLDLVQMFLELGGQNLIVPVLAYQRFYDHGEEYTQAISEMCLWLINPEVLDFYRAHDIDPYFIGIDTLLKLPQDQPGYRLGAELTAFHETWPYQEGRRKVLWEVAPIPLYSFWRAHEVMGEEAQAELESTLAGTSDLQVIHDTLYRYYARAVYGTDIPIPHFYLGANRNGDLKLRSMLPIAMLCGGPFRMFFTPYPSLFVTQETLQAILEDLAFGKPLRSTTADYSGQYTSELAEAEYQRILQVSADPTSTVGLLRQLATSDSP